MLQDFRRDVLMQIPETVLQIGAYDWLGHPYRSVEAFNLGALQADFDVLKRKNSSHASAHVLKSHLERIAATAALGQTPRHCTHLSMHEHGTADSITLTASIMGQHGPPLKI